MPVAAAVTASRRLGVHSLTHGNGTAAPQTPPLERAQSACTRVGEHDLVGSAAERLARNCVSGVPVGADECVEFGEVGVVDRKRCACQVVAREVKTNLVPEDRAPVAAAKGLGLLARQ